MSIQIDLPPEIEARLEREAVEQGQDPGQLAADVLRRHVVLRELNGLADRRAPKTLDEVQPRIPPPPGKSWLEGVIGQWPGDESDEEMKRAIEELS